MPTYPRIAAQSGAVDPSGTYAGYLPAVASFTYNADGTIATATEAGVTSAFTYNADGTLASVTRGGVTRTLSYSGGNLVGVA